MAAVGVEQDKGMEVVAMSRELSIYEAMGGTYTEVNGILYPDIVIGNTNCEISEPGIIDCGKYGRLWISYMKDNHQDRYLHYLRMGELYKKACEVNEEAYEMLDVLVEQYLKKHKPVNRASSMEMWKLREQAKLVAEEVLYEELVYRIR